MKKKKIPSFTTGKVTIQQISNKELQRIMDSAIKKWHFERTEHGVKPVSDE